MSAKEPRPMIANGDRRETERSRDARGRRGRPAVKWMSGGSTAGRSLARLIAGVACAAAAGILVHAAAEPARLVGVTAEGDAIVIESTEPAAYSVSRPNPTTVV